MFHRHSLLYQHYICRFIIGVSFENFLIAIEFITSQSEFLGVRIAESFSIVPENIVGKITFISVFGVFGKSLCINRSLGILIVE